MTRAKAKKEVAKPLRAELSEKGKARREAVLARNLARPERPESVINAKNKKWSIEPAKGQDNKLYSAEMLEAFGTRSVPFLNATMQNIARVMSPTLNITSQQHNAVIAIMASVEPENELEATLAAQMVMANECAVRCMRGMVGTDMSEHHKMYGDLANKFMRTFTSQVEALSRLRRGGEQVIKHVYVGEGGQAVFAREINHSGGVKVGSDEQGHRAGQSAQCASLPCPDAAWDGVPIPGHAERAVPDSRGAFDRSAEGE